MSKHQEQLTIADYTFSFTCYNSLYMYEDGSYRQYVSVNPVFDTHSLPGKSYAATVTAWELVLNPANLQEALVTECIQHLNKLHQEGNLNWWISTFTTDSSEAGE